MPRAIEHRKPAIRNYSPLLAGGSAVVLLATLFVVSQGRIKPMLPARLGALVMVLIEEGSVAAAWLAAALGYGYMVRRVVNAGVGAGGSAPSGRPLNAGRVSLGVSWQWVAGAAVLMLIDWTLGCFGALSAGSVWVVSVAGWGLISWQVWSLNDRWKTAPWPSVSWQVVLGAPAVGLLLGAATIAPGVLWGSEFGAYDVLEYHLQLPREWIDAGRITGLHHNVYSYMPNLFEAAFTHLAVWRGGALDAAYAAQILHAAMALLTALAIARLVNRTCGRGGALAGTIYLATPWTIITGSLAYNEQTVMAMGAAALGLVLPAQEGSAPSGQPLNIRAAALAGFLCGAAVLCKLPALGLIALPLGVVVLRGERLRWRHAIVFGTACVCVVALWMVRNTVWTGDPLFPMIGRAHWTAEQAQRFAHAHDSAGVLSGLAALGDQLLWHWQFGILVVPAAVLGAVVGWRHPATKTTTRAALTVAAIQIAFWLLFTHHQSRFLIPLLLPLCVLIGAGVAAWRSEHTAGLVAAFVAMWCTAASFTLYLIDTGITGRPGEAGYFIDGVSVLKDLRADTPVDTPYTVINGLLPPESRVYCEGFAAPLYIDRPITYHTVWDRSELGEAMAAGEPGGVSRAHQWLRQLGYTHVLIDWAMLDRWMSPGNYGYDPHIKPEALKALADAVLEPVHSWGGLTLYRVK